MLTLVTPTYFRLYWIYSQIILKNAVSCHHHIPGRRVTEEESDFSGYDPSQDDVVAGIFHRKGNNDPFSSQAKVTKKSGSANQDQEDAGIANLEISVPRPMVNSFVLKSNLYLAKAVNLKFFQVKDLKAKFSHLLA